MIIETLHNVGDAFYTPRCRQIKDVQVVDGRRTLVNTYEASVEKHFITRIRCQVNLDNDVKWEYQIDEDANFVSQQYLDDRFYTIDQARAIAEKLAEKEQIYLAF